MIAGKIATGAVNSAAIADGTVDTADLRAGAVTAAKLGAGAVDSSAVARRLAERRRTSASPGTFSLAPGTLIAGAAAPSRSSTSPASSPATTSC